MVRCFVNIETGEKQKERIGELVEELEKIPADIKFVKPENFHLTPRFLGNISEEELEKAKKGLEKAAKQSSPFELNLKGTGVFPNRNYIKVIWVGAEKCRELVDLKKRVDDCIKVGKKDDREFVPHVTIGRMKSGKNKDKVLEKLDEYEDFDFGAVEIDKINIKKSKLKPEGPEYSVLY